MNATLPQLWAEDFLAGYAGFDDSLSRYLGVNQSRVLRSLFERLSEAMGSRLADFGLLAGEALFRRLRAAGANIGVYGLDYRRLQQLSAPNDVLETSDVDRSRALLVTSFARKVTAPSGPDKIIWQCDHPLQQSACASFDSSSSHQELGAVHEHLHADGFARVDNWGFDMDTLEAQCRAALSRSKAEGGQDMPIPELQSILGNSSIAGLITGYLGASVRYDGHVIKNTPSVWTRAKMRTFPAGKWHHDRCGRRLKMFIYLSNVTSRSHPTTIAAGTHNTMYYSHSSQFFDLSRYSDEHVRKHHRVEAMHGLRGGGFIFDTNALHKIEMIGSDPRLLLALEFHPHGKVPALRRFPDNPCPSRRKLFESLFKNNTRWAHGEFDFPLYPPER